MKKSICILIFGFILISSSGCHVGRYFMWNIADINDHKKFSNIVVEKGSTTFKFIENIDQDLFSEIPYQNKAFHLDEILKMGKNKTVAFLVIRNDTILYEKYLHKYDQNSIIPSFSVAKSFISALVGIAVEEGKINSVHDPVTQYLPGLCEADPAFELMTIQHLLDMRSGIDFNEYAYLNPFNGIARLYYGLNIKKQMYKLEIEDLPGDRYEYKSTDGQLLGLILEAATGKTPAAYLEEKIWKPLGMQYDATWSIDSKKNKTIKAFCCLNATARDLARFGRLYLKNGNWNGDQIIPEYWIKRSITPTPPYRGYQNLWYSMRTPVYYPDSLTALRERKPYEQVGKSRRYPGKYYVRGYGPAYVASGLLGQYIYVDPRKNLVIVRLGKGKGGISWWQLFERIAEVM